MDFRESEREQFSRRFSRVRLCWLSFPLLSLELRVLVHSQFTAGFFFVLKGCDMLAWDALYLSKHENILGYSVEKLRR